MTENVYSALFKFGAEAAENYLTEAFAFLLRLLLERDASTGRTILNHLCGFSVRERHQHVSSIEISTQVAVKHGCVDIEIRDTGDTLVYVEVKHDASLAIGQLEGYKRDLDESGIPGARLVFLTRSRASTRDTTLERKDYHHVCWYEVSAWLSHAETTDAVCQYFISSFVAFLEEKSMTVKRVTWEYMQGISALVDLMKMLEAALTECVPAVHYVRTGGFGHCGFLVKDKYWFGIRYQKPTLLAFEDNKGYPPKTYERCLNLETAHFFSLDEGEQFERIIEFLRETYPAAETHPSASQPSSPPPAS